MCGRYAASAQPDELVELFEVELDGTGEPTRSVLVNPQDPPPATPDYNMAPSKQAQVVLERAGRDPADDAVRRQLRLLTWGLVPSWAKDARTGVRMTNARAETLLDKPAYRRAATSRRCLVPASGWYEWQASPVAVDARGRPRKQPFFVRRHDDDVLAMAGLYEFWRDPATAPEDPLGWLVTFTVVTTAAEPGLDRIHDRQPAVLDRDRWDAWLDPGLTDPDAVADLLSAPDSARFRAWPVSRAVNTTAHNGPHLLTPVPDEDLVGVVDPATGEVLGA
ncbi:SOS response-associated peptidase [Ornithinimicrobium sediminis]|uniref:SOS response-associated peptidase n=1 Tax=Ornithinimicrobium sediminis TaxID=2904603 RepID=UPI001E378B49|nr:SOS response-associated peptidase [Ornithinimicrobium sediminis]MCE0486340.1 SOS response-associated peptidase [Ornithinimicrobium sediminis]